MKDDKSYENPKYMGPGLWYYMHKLSYDSRTPQEQEFCIKAIRTIIYNFPCSECREHAIKYFENNSIEEYKDNKYEDENLGLFIWTVNFHNVVNKRLKYPLMSLEAAKILYSKDTLCESKCDAAKYL